MDRVDDHTKRHRERKTPEKMTAKKFAHILNEPGCDAEVGEVGRLPPDF